MRHALDEYTQREDLRDKRMQANDYHHANIEDGLLFEEDIGEALMGLGASPKGARKIEQRVAQWHRRGAAGNEAEFSTKPPRRTPPAEPETDD